MAGKKKKKSLETIQIMIVPKGHVVWDFYVVGDVLYVRFLPKEIAYPKLKPTK